MFTRISKGLLILYFIAVFIVWIVFIGEKETKVIGWVILGAGLVIGFMFGLFVELVNNILDIKIILKKFIKCSDTSIDRMENTDLGIQEEQGFTQYGNSGEGDIITFGNYNGSTQWIVLKRIGNRLLLLSKKEITNMAYHEVREDVTWEDCTLRKWLNSDYLSLAFSKEERTMIQPTQLSNHYNPKYGTYGGNETEDRVFLLSLEEAEELFHNDKNRELLALELDWWWLRSPGDNSHRAATVYSDGSVYYCGISVDLNHAVRPALWINLDS